jgi:putative PIN family toxin of toxin-antitoxin system
MRLVLDTAFLVAAIRSDAGASRVLLRAALEKQCTILVSVPLMIEYQAVMTRPEHLLASRLSVDDVEALLDAVVLVSEPVRLAFLWRPMLKDPNDDMVLETAVNGGADMLATFNRRDSALRGKRFGFEVGAPREVLRRMKGAR